MTDNKIEIAEAIEDIKILKKLNDEKQREIERLQQYANELENKINFIQAEKDKDTDFKNIEIERMLNKIRVLQEAVAELTLERLGIL